MAADGRYFQSEGVIVVFLNNIACSNTERKIVKEPNNGSSPLICADNPYPLSSKCFRRNLDVNGTCSPSKNPVGMYHTLD
jgi:hypothetical protein